ncbi:MAG: hypothetical protein ACRDQ0_09260, partial [Pseudonocardia sp.]
TLLYRLHDLPEPPVDDRLGLPFTGLSLPGPDGAYHIYAADRVAMVHKVTEVLLGMNHQIARVAERAVPGNELPGYPHSWLTLGVDFELHQLAMKKPAELRAFINDYPNVVEEIRTVFAERPEWKELLELYAYQVHLLALRKSIENPRFFVTEMDQKKALDDTAAEIRGTISKVAALQGNEQYATLAILAQVVEDFGRRDSISRRFTVELVRAAAALAVEAEFRNIASSDEWTLRTALRLVVWTELTERLRYQQSDGVAVLISVGNELISDQLPPNLRPIFLFGRHVSQSLARAVLGQIDDLIRAGAPSDQRGLSGGAGGSGAGPALGPENDQEGGTKPATETGSTTALPTSPERGTAQARAPPLWKRLLRLVTGGTALIVAAAVAIRYDLDPHTGLIAAMAAIPGPNAHRPLSARDELTRDDRRSDRGRSRSRGRKIREFIDREIEKHVDVRDPSFREKFAVSPRDSGTATRVTGNLLEELAEPVVEQLARSLNAKPLRNVTVKVATASKTLGDLREYDYLIVNEESGLIRYVSAKVANSEFKIWREKRLLEELVSGLPTETTALREYLTDKKSLPPGTIEQITGLVVSWRGSDEQISLQDFRERYHLGDVDLGSIEEKITKVTPAGQGDGLHIDRTRHELWEQVTSRIQQKIDASGAGREGTPPAARIPAGIAALAIAVPVLSELNRAAAVIVLGAVALVAFGAAIALPVVHGIGQMAHAWTARGPPARAVQPMEDGRSERG